MDNASKAIIISAGFFIAVLLISVFMYLLTSFRDFQEASEMAVERLQVISFNSKYAEYTRVKNSATNTLKGYQVYNLIGQCIDDVLKTDSENMVSITDTGGNINDTYAELKALQDNFYYTETLDKDFIIENITYNSIGYIENIELSSSIF